MVAGNGTSGLLLIFGLFLIKSGKRGAHKVCMLSAVAVSAIFLASYLTYHYHAGSTPFQGVGWTRTLYFSILISHTILAALVVPLVAITMTLGLREKFETHRKLARWTFPIWLYVSITGVLVYFMLYHWFATG